MKGGENLMKKVIALIVSLIFLVAFTAGCKPAETPKPEAPKTAEAPAPEQTAEAPAPVPPPEELTAPPDVVVVPSGPSYVYMVPNTVGLYFYDGYWYRFYDRHWYRSTIYNGAWTYIDLSIVPGVILDVPPDYILHIPHGYYRIHYSDFHRNWRMWGHSRYWHRHDWYKHRWYDRRDWWRDRRDWWRDRRDRRHDRGDRWRDRRDRRHDRGDRWRDRKDRRHDRVDLGEGDKKYRRPGLGDKVYSGRDSRRKGI
jgi:hypothetical protein